MRRHALVTAGLLAVISVRVHAQEPHTSPLVTDRPDFTESSTVVGPGIVQVETGAVFEVSRTGGGRAHTLTAPLGLVRIGVHDRVELRIGGDGFVSTPDARGLADMDVGVKIRTVHSETRGFDAAVILLVTVPTGSQTMTSGAYDPALKLTFAQSLPKGFDLSGNVNVSRVTDSGTSFSQRAYSVSASHDLRGGWGGYWEAFGFSSLEKHGRVAWTLDTGITHGIGTNAQFDIEVGRGVTAAAPSWVVGAGVSVRGRGFGPRR